jgi:class I fructose-bisphosphate aldolase
MEVSKRVKEILSWYSNENNGVRTNLARILMHGELSGTGKMVILPVDQGFEHGPDRSFGMNPDAYDPEYHFKIAVEAKLNAYAAPLGMLEACADKFVGQIPLILKINSSNSLLSKTLSPNQAITASVKDALRLGCVGVGMTIYPGSNNFQDMLEEAKDIISEAKANGLAVIIWSYPRGEGISKEGESALDVCCYAGHIAALIGANIIKLKPPTDFVEKAEAKQIYKENNIQTAGFDQRIKHVMRSVFNGKRLVVFSGGATKSDAEILNEVTMLSKANASGSIIGRNSFQRPFSKSLILLQNICQIYKAQL